MPTAAPPLPLRDRIAHALHRLAGLRRPDLALARRLGRPLSDRQYLALGHLAYFGRWPDYDHPRSYNEQVQAYMLRCRSPWLKLAADKLATREYVARLLGEEYLVPLIGVWDDANDVPLMTLPRPSVVKTSVGSGQLGFLRVGVYTDLVELRQNLRRWLTADFAQQSREWAYQGLRNRVFAEELLSGEDGEGGEDAALPADHKVYVIGARVRFIQVDRGRFGRHTRNLYDADWRLLPARLTLRRHAPDPRPPRLAEMLAHSLKLAEPFECLRVDWYAPGDRLCVGELTNYPGAGFERFIPHAFALEMGRDWPQPVDPPAAQHPRA